MLANHVGQCGVSAETVRSERAQRNSVRTLDLHVTLYEGYVQETNRLTERIDEFLMDGLVEEMQAFSEFTRRRASRPSSSTARSRLCVSPADSSRPAADSTRS